MITDRITVPHLSATALVAQAKEELRLTNCDDRLTAWNFVTDEGGKTYEVLTHRFGYGIDSDEVQAFFRERGFRGSAAVFVAWVTEKNPEGDYVSVPEDDGLWYEPGSSVPYAPSYCRDDVYRVLRQRNVRYGWLDYWDFVAFRELPQSA